MQHDDYVKIGHTKDVRERIKSIQTNYPVKLKVIGLIEGDFSDEKKYHVMFSDIHSNGEWFHYTSDLAKFIKGLPLDLMWQYGYVDNELLPTGQIKSLRLLSGLSMQDLADRIGITKQSVCTLEKMEIQGRITINRMHKLADALGCKFQYRIIEK